LEVLRKMKGFQRKFAASFSQNPKLANGFGPMPSKLENFLIFVSWRYAASR
jgi:hypothetical protein